MSVGRDPQRSSNHNIACFAKNSASMHRNDCDVSFMGDDSPPDPTSETRLWCTRRHCSWSPS
eukprot:4921608-Alexandrium_andersonii.AAC.1